MRRIFLKIQALWHLTHCPVHKTACTAVYSLTDGSPYTVHVDINYTIIPVFCNYLPEDGPCSVETCRRYCVKLNYSKCALVWFYFVIVVTMGHAVAQLVEALRYKSEGRGFDSRWCHWNFSLT